MSQPNIPPMNKPDPAGLLSSEAQPGPDKQHQRERLLYLFRQSSHDLDARFLLELMARYRGIELP